MEDVQGIEVRDVLLVLELTGEVSLSLYKRAVLKVDVESEQGGDVGSGGVGHDFRALAEERSVPLEKDEHPNGSLHGPARYLGRQKRLLGREWG